MTDTKQGVIYLACPYSHEDPAVEQQRFEAVTQAAAELTSGGRTVFSPITMTHPITEAIRARDGKEPDHKGWMDFDQPFMEMCSEIYVLMLDGLLDSTGVQQELNYFFGDKPVTFMSVTSAETMRILTQGEVTVSAYGYVTDERFQPLTQEAPPEEPEQWKPIMGERYSVIINPDTAFAMVDPDMWKGSRWQNSKLIDGYAFRTRAEAVAKLQAMNEQRITGE